MNEGKQRYVVIIEGPDVNHGKLKHFLDHERLPIDFKVLAITTIEPEPNTFMYKET